jgi:hypothetical protein
VRILTALLASLSVLAACQLPYAHPPPILLFAGTGTSPGDVIAFESVLRERAMLYTTANSRQLDAMTAAQLRTFRLLIVPGGNFEAMGNGLRHGTSAKVRPRSITTGRMDRSFPAGARWWGNIPMAHRQSCRDTWDAAGSCSTASTRKRRRAGAAI